MTKMGRPTLGSGSMEDIDSEDRVRVLGIIDQFRELGVNEDISLPQLVVVGDQSSGKSSLLEGLTGLNFPIASELCTRFATQIVLRRAPFDGVSIRVSILPGPSAIGDDDRKEKLQAFSRNIDGDGLDASKFAEILDEAAICMGLPSTIETNFEGLVKRFSDDVLKIELSGPEHHHLSVVDVPGLFHNPTKYQTQDDLDIIRTLLESYVVDRRTIILAVMDGRNNLANQEVFRMARAADPQGKRTVGIITKCDALQPGDEKAVLDIALNSVERLTHGWFVVKNRSTKDIQNGVTLEQRHASEKKFFSCAPWNALPRDRVGILKLRVFLGKLLYDHIKGEFPALIQEIRNLVAESRAALDTLGAPRQTTVQQRQFLSRIAARYQQRVSAGLRGDYGPEWEPDDSRKLRMHLHLSNEAFAAKMSRDGHTRAFRNVDDTTEEAFGARPLEEHIYEWIRRGYRESRGAELPGTVNPAVLESLFRQQASKWRPIAEDHLQCIDDHVTKFDASAWSDLAIEEDIRDKMEGHNEPKRRDAFRAAMQQLQVILDDELKGILQTVNHYYADNLTKARSDRVLHRLKSLGLQNDTQRSVYLDEVIGATHISNEDQAVHDIHDILKAYYKVALKRFTDNITIQCVERCYVGEGGPLKYISPELIGELTDDGLDHIARENYATSSARTETSHRLERLEKALSIAEAERL